MKNLKRYEELQLLSDELISLEHQISCLHKDLSLLNVLSNAIKEDDIDEGIISIYGDSLRMAGISLGNQEIAQEGIFSGIKKLAEKLMGKYKDHILKIIRFYTKLKVSIKQSFDNTEVRLSQGSNGSASLKTSDYNGNPVRVNNKLELSTINKVASGASSDLKLLDKALKNINGSIKDVFYPLRKLTYVSVIENGEDVIVENYLDNESRGEHVMIDSYNSTFKSCCKNMYDALHELLHNYIPAYIDGNKRIEKDISKIANRIKDADKHEKDELKKELGELNTKATKLSMITKYVIHDIQTALNDLYSYPIKNNMSKMG